MEVPKGGFLLVFFFHIKSNALKKIDLSLHGNILHFYHFFFPMYFVDWTTLGSDQGSSKAGMWQMVLQTQLGERISKETWLRSLLFYFLLRDQSLTAERLGVTMWGWPNIVMCITLKHGTSLQHVIPHATEHHVLACLCRRDPCHLLLPSVLPCHAAGWEEGGNSCCGMSKTS